MKNFSLKTRANSRRNSKKVQLIGILLVIAAMVLLLHFFGDFAGRIGSTISMPVYGLRSWVTESGAILPSYIRSRNDLISEMNILKEELNAQSGKDAIIRKMIRENEELRSLLGVQDPESIVAAVTARPPYLPYDAVLIDQGSTDGIKDGAIVYHANGQAIGFVSAVFAHGALVTLFSTPGITATAYILGPDIYVTMDGEGGGVIRISVPQGIEIEKGDVVILPSLEAGILGTVRDIESSPTQPVQYGYVVSDIPIQSLHLVSVSSEVPETVTYEEAEVLIDEHRLRQQFIIDIPEEVIEEGQATSTDGSETDGSETETMSEE